jgi:hypothetical protein
MYTTRVTSDYSTCSGDNNICNQRHNTQVFEAYFFFQKFKDIDLETFLNFEYYVQKSLTDDKND